MVAISWFCLAGLISILLFLALYLLIGQSLYSIVFSRNSRFKKKVERRQNNDFENDFWDKNQFQDVNIISHDGLKLYAKYLNKGGAKVVLLVHGYGGNYKDMAKYAQIFLNKGYDLLVVDNRAHGKSEGKIVGMSWEDRFDIQSWCEFLTKVNPCYKIVLFGQSMGASAVCNFAGEKNNYNVVGVIEDCGFDNAYKQILYLFNRTKIKLKLFFKVFTFYSNKKNGYNLKEVDCLKQLKNTHIPLLIIHGSDDHFVPTEMAYNIYNSANEFEREIYVAKDARHTKSFEVDEKKYKNVIYNFLDKYKI